MLDLKTKFERSKCGKVSVFHSDLYEKILSKFVGKDDFSLLEIGVWFGESLCVWRECFPEARLHGVDCDYPENARIPANTQLFVGDQSYVPFMRHVAEKIGSLDVVIDDGGHWCDDQQISFNTLWPIMRKGGVYVIEDLWVAKDRVLDGYECTIDFLDKLDIRKEWYKGFHDFEKDICVLYKE